ncbi:MAG: hypothetical protein HY721_20315 [Planctomycetes bacterium]|nr:hypothetical protein [Planctomycetota bacterium]
MDTAHAPKLNDHPPWDPSRIEALTCELEAIRADAARLEAEFAPELARLDGPMRDSGRNLLHYLALRRRDIRALQHELATLGLSSLGRAESHVLGNLEAVLAILRHIAGRPQARRTDGLRPIGFDEGRRLLEAHAGSLLGKSERPGPAGRSVRIMVTMPADAATDPVLVRELLSNGMDLMRINCAHDDPAAWSRMVENLRRAQQELGRPCRVLMDLAGPKLRTGYLGTDDGADDRLPGGSLFDCVIAPASLPLAGESIEVFPGDELVLTRRLDGGRHPRRDRRGTLLDPGVVPCTLPEVFAFVRTGEKVWFDDGKIGAVVAAAGPDEVRVRITACPLTGRKLRADRGINLPDSSIELPALTAKDLQDLETVVKVADLVGLSFLNSAADVAALQEELARRTDRKLGIVLKIETRRAFAQLPRILLAALRTPPVGVMIARGDLAVECGYERLAEVQEEILWICEAAHAPVIWATQVLETLAKKGTPSRAEITDAAMGERAECVMLNKGPHVVDAVRVLDDILRRMRSHQDKKTALLRALSLSNLDGGEKDPTPPRIAFAED